MTNTDALPPLTRRRTRLIALMAVPTVITTLGLGGIEVWRNLQPQSRLRSTPFTYSFGDAIAIDDLQQAYRFIRSGQDPNEPIAVRHPALTRGQWVLVPPVLWAVALQNTHAFPMLLGFGARLDPATARRARCLAEALGNHEIVRVLNAIGGAQSAEPCVTLEPGDAPLLRVVADAE